MDRNNSKSRYKENHPDRVAESHRRYKARPENKRKAYYDQIRRKYGLDEAGYTALIVSQGGRCPVCRAELVDAVVDHNHKTGRIRSVLCRWCNATLGHLKEDPEIIRRLASYIETY